MSSSSSESDESDNEEIGELQEPVRKAEDYLTSFNRYDVESVADPYKFLLTKHYGPDKQGQWHKNLINRMLMYKSGKLKLNAKQLDDILNYKSSNLDILSTKQKNNAIIPGPYSHIGPGNPIYYKSYSALDDIAREHDINYSHAKNPLDVYLADRRMLKRLENTTTNGAYEWFVKQVATGGIKVKHAFELQYGVLYPKFSKEQIDFMKENYPEYGKIMREVELKNEQMIKNFNDTSPQIYTKILNKIGQKLTDEQRGKLLNFAKQIKGKATAMITKGSTIFGQGAVWKDPYLRDIIQFAERYHAQQESNYVNDPKNMTKMIQIHYGFYAERETYWKERLSILRHAGFKPTDQEKQQLNKLKEDLQNLDTIEHEALYNYANYDDRGWGHAFSYDFYWELAEYHNNQLKHWITQTYDDLNSQRTLNNELIPTPTDNAEINTTQSDATLHSAVDSEL